MNPAPSALPLRPALALAVVSGVAFAPGFPPLGWWPCTLLAFAPLYVALAGQTPRRALLLGWVSLLVSSTLVFSWLVGTIRDFGGLPTPVAVLALLLLSAWHGLRLGLATWLTARAERRGWPAAPTFVAAVLALEWTFPLLFTWNLATSMGDHDALLQTAELGGPLLVDLTILLPSVALGELWRARHARRRPAIGTVVAGLVVPALAALWGTHRIDAVRARQAEAPELRIGLVQPNLPMGAESVVPDLQAATQRLASAGAELVLWPETAVHTSYNDYTYPTKLPEQVTGVLGVPTLFGVRTWRAGATEDAQKVRHNSAMLSDQDGRILGRYDKHELLAFGEYTPLANVFPALAKLMSHARSFTAGEGVQPLEWAGHRIVALICYEDTLPTYVNAQVAAADPDLLVNLTNDAWFGDTAEPWIHQSEARLRAVEHRRYMVRATNSGPSGVIDATGRPEQLGRLFETEERIVTARLLRGGTLYERVGDAVGWVAAATILAAALLRRRRAPETDGIGG